jgi:hypothetical protein
MYMHVHSCAVCWIVFIYILYSCTLSFTHSSSYVSTSPRRTLHHIRAEVCVHACVCVRARVCGCTRIRTECTSTSRRRRPRAVESQAFFSATAFNANIGAWNTARVTSFHEVCAVSAGACNAADALGRSSMWRGRVREDVHARMWVCECVRARVRVRVCACMSACHI